jgi:DNA-binding LytR/AlgR family response regulator
MIKILIIEDEKPARNKLRRFIEELDLTIEIIGETDTVESSLSFLKNNSPDLIFSDIELLDGNVFEVYNQVMVSCPIIFTTAYDQYWMEAFDGNGIAYLLKPFSRERFQKSWEKFLMIRNTPADANTILSSLSKILGQHQAEKTKRRQFTIHSNRGISFLNTENIVFFEANEGVVFAYDTTGKKHLLTETTLKEIEEQLDPSGFFRLNRSELVNKIHIEKMERHTKNTLAIKLKGYQKHLITSQSTTALFRSWINQ